MARRIHRLAPAEDVERELRAHIDLRASELVAAGWDPTAARAEAVRVFGDYDAIRGECRAVAERYARSTRRTRLWSELAQDMRYAWRGLVKQPLFAVVAIVTLALGIGANSAAFGIVNGVLLTPLPYPEPARLVTLREVNESGREVNAAWPNFRDLQAGTRTLAGLAAYQQSFPKMVIGTPEPVRAQFARVSATFFEVIGVAPAVGRAFTGRDLTAAGAVPVVASDAFWRRELNGTRDLSALRLSIDGMPIEVIGVMPAAFNEPQGTDVWWPLDVHEAAGYGSRSAHNFQLLGRLAAGVSRGQAQQELTAVAQRIRERDAESDAVAVAVHDMLQHSVRDTKRALLILLGASTFVLLVACTNLASALLARAAGRNSELAVRASLGARRVRLIRQLLTESLLLALLGAAAGLALAQVLMRTAIAFGAGAIPRLQEVRLDGWLLAFTTFVAVATALTFGIAPALRATMVQPYDALRAGGRGTETISQRRAWSLLVATEVALALMLLIGSGLLIRSFHKLTSVDPGFDMRNVVAVDITLPRGKYDAGDARVRYYDTVLERVRAQPGVAAAAVTMTLPLGGFDPSGDVDIEGGGGDDGGAAYRIVSPDYFQTMRMPIVQGRAFTSSDRSGALDVAVIDEDMARQSFQGENPIGKRFSTGGMDGRAATWVTIVGVVRSVRYESLDAPAEPAYYLPHAQRPERMMSASLLVRAQRDAGSLLQAVRETIRPLDNDVGLEVTTLEARAGESLAGRTFMLLVLAIFAGIALVLAAIGIYSVVAVAVARRTREIGIRVALGAASARVLWTVSRHTITAVAAGMVAGIVAALLLARLTTSLLYDVQPFDPMTYVAVCLLLLLIAGVALMIPALRALRVTPMMALRND